MCAVYKRSDRTARLLKLEMLLAQNPGGLEIEEIARRCSISSRTVYRDLKALEYELEFPIWEDGARRGVVEGFFLPPITFTTTEAMTIYLAARILQNQSHIYSPGIASTFMKLNTIVPQPLRQQVQNTIEYIEKQPRDERKIKNFNKLTEACLHTYKVKITYQRLSDETPKERIIEPYAIEPSLLDRSNYVIGFCPLEKGVRTFNIDRIIGQVFPLEEEKYAIPANFNITDYLGSAWNIHIGEPVETIKLRFSSRVSKAIMETIWHPSQKIEPQTDGSIVMTLGVQITLYFRHWIMGWGNDIEVLEPLSLRAQIILTAKSMLDIYEQGMNSPTCFPNISF
jgi:predicted DNA-binding transcriptional regulator YafY